MKPDPRSTVAREGAVKAPARQESHHRETISASRDHDLAVPPDPHVLRVDLVGERDDPVVAERAVDVTIGLKAYQPGARRGVLSVRNIRRASDQDLAVGT